jgi:hypothetical protein
MGKPACRDNHNRPLCLRAKYALSDLVAAVSEARRRADPDTAEVGGALADALEEARTVLQLLERPPSGSRGTLGDTADQPR